MADQAFYQIYKNNDIYKDSVKLLSASGEYQQDVAYNTGTNGKMPWRMPAKNIVEYKQKLSYKQKSRDDFTLSKVAPVKFP